MSTYEEQVRLYEALPVGEQNPVEILYDCLGRKQPPVISISGDVASALSDDPGTLAACVENVPAGSGLIIDVAMTASELCVPSLEEELTVLILSDATDVLDLGTRITETTRQGILL